MFQEKKIVKRLEYCYEIRSDDGYYTLRISSENLSEFEILGILTVQKQKMLEHLMEDDDIWLSRKERGLESEVKPDEPEQTPAS